MASLDMLPTAPLVLVLARLGAEAKLGYGGSRLHVRICTHLCVYEGMRPMTSVDREEGSVVNALLHSCAPSCVNLSRGGVQGPPETTQRGQ